MNQYAYSPATGELIRTDTPAPWMGVTEVVPPEFDPATAGCFWRGNVWEIVPSAPVGPTPEQQQAALEAAVQAHLDNTAHADGGWDDLASVVRRAGYPGPWQTKGVAYGIWGDECWLKCYAIEADVQAGKRPIPTEAELIAALPPAPSV